MADTIQQPVESDNAGIVTQAEGPVLRGRVVRWAGGKSFGFIQPYYGGGEEVFVHISALPNQKVPKSGCPVEYQVWDRQGRRCAVNVRYATPREAVCFGE
jgi:cold shock CspA family protein